jgi:RNA polymerase sigma factor (sigma-70 family)
METSVLIGEGLLARARQGSQSALGELLASCRPWLQRRVQSRMPRELARKQDGSDLVQECQYLAAARIDEFRGGSLGEFRAWLGGILDRRVLRALRFWGERRRDRRREEPLGPAWVDGPSGEPAATATSALGRISRDEQCERLRLAASWCRPDDLEVISLHLFEGRGHDEIAAELGISAAAARQRYCRAVRRVAGALRLLERMTRLGWGALRQDVVGVHRFRGAGPAEIAGRLQVPEELAARWIAEARPLLRAMASEEDPS